jgi:Ca-activated chloride channel family protein
MEREAIMLRHIEFQCYLSIFLVLTLVGISIGQTEILIPDNVIVPHCRSYGFSRAGEPVIRIADVKAHIEMTQNITAVTTLIINLENMSLVEQSSELIIPAPEGITLRDIYVGQEAKPVSGQVLTKTQATLNLGQMIVDVNDPALIEFIDTCLIRSDPFDIPAGTIFTIGITYKQELEINSNRVDYLLPRTEWILYGVPWEISVRINANQTLSAIYSPTHKLDIQREGHDIASAMTVNESSTMAGPFRLYYLLEDIQGFTSSALIYPSDEYDGGYFLLMAGLPMELQVNEYDIKRELTLVLDRFGSMSGIKIEQVKQAARKVISGLADGEAFNLITYNSRVDKFNNEPLPKNNSTVQAAFNYLDSINATGSTNLYEALQTGLLQEPTEGFLPVIMFLTDGLPTVGERREVYIRDLVLSSNPYNRRVFTFGVGYDLNAPLLDGLAEYSLARSVFVSPEDDVEAAITEVFSSLFQPLFTDVGIRSVSTEGIPGEQRTYNVLPFSIVDLFQGDRLVLIGQYVGKEPFLFEINGNYRNQFRSFSCSVEQQNGSIKQGFIPRLWSGRFVAQVINEIRQLGADPKLSKYNDRLWDLSVAMIELSLNYGILTEYTAFFGDGSVELLNYVDLIYFGWTDLYNRAVKAREGKSAVNQSLNLNYLKSQSVLNRDNLYIDRNMNEVRTTTIQQINDATLYFHYGEGIWIDSRLLVPPEDPNATLESVVIEFGTPEFIALAIRLAAQSRQGCLGMAQSLMLWESGDIVGVIMPERVAIPPWAENPWPNQIITRSEQR